MDLIRERVKNMEAEEAGELLSCGEEVEDYHDKFAILNRMGVDEAFQEGVIKNFRPPYL